MTREQYRNRLEDLRADILYMGELVGNRLRRALDALSRKDTAVAREVIDGDETINRQYLELEAECVTLIARQQPVAGDLRFIAASFKILTDLERIGDLATNLAAYAKESERDVFSDVEVQQIGSTTLAMLDAATAAYEDADVDLCWAVARRDDELDDMCEKVSNSIVRRLISSVDLTETEIEAIMPEVRWLLLTIRDLERVGDHTVNIAARALYMVENDDELLE